MTTEMSMAYYAVEINLAQFNIFLENGRFNSGNRTILINERYSRDHVWMKSSWKIKVRNAKSISMINGKYLWESISGYGNVLGNGSYKNL